MILLFSHHLPLHISIFTILEEGRPLFFTLTRPVRVGYMTEMVGIDSNISFRTSSGELGNDDASFI